MSTGVLLVTLILELTIGVLRFIAVHLRESARRKGLKPSKWQLVPYSFKVDWFVPDDRPRGRSRVPQKGKSVKAGLSD